MQLRRSLVQNLRFFRLLDRLLRSLSHEVRRRGHRLYSEIRAIAGSRWAYPNRDIEVRGWLI
jgi:hypothetical protein